ncbi:transposase [Streptomyces sp. NPDC058470]|uniref:transposase n=1 Tax=Streptomyces sp. NPDC058470 TaxID=3346515 RepID=UPI003659FC33
MAEKRRTFDPEFREGVVRIVTEDGKPVAEVAKDLASPWPAECPGPPGRDGAGRRER